MISWIKGEVVTLWQGNNKFFVLINCQGIGYEIQVPEPIFIELKTKQISNDNLILWLKHIKKEDSDMLFGFKTKEQKDFFVEIINIRGIGSQIAISLLNKFTVEEVIYAIISKDKKLISSVQGIGQKMAERIILELKNKLSMISKFDKEIKNSNLFKENQEINTLMKDISLTLQSLNYTDKEIKKLFPILIKEINNKSILEKDKISFENILKLAMNHLDNNSNLVI